MPKLTVLLLAALAACSTAQPGTAPPPAAMPAATALPAGVYTVTLVDADVPPMAPASLRGAMVGPWEMTIDGSGVRALVRFNGRQVADIPLQVQGNQVTFTEGTGDYACQTAARYTWETTPAGLRFTGTEDSCTGRVVALTARPWVKRP